MVIQRRTRFPDLLEDKNDVISYQFKGYEIKIEWKKEWRGCAATEKKPNIQGVLGLLENIIYDMSQTGPCGIRRNATSK